jgi:F-type H+-transporting ATPase subunit beta
MNEELQLNVPLLRRRIPNLTTAAREAGLRAATVSNLCTGKIPVGRAEVRTLVILASLAGCSLDDLIIRGTGGGMIETGIKVLDLLAPIVRGGTIGLVARPNTGQLVMLSELFRRLGQRGYATVFWKPKNEFIGKSDVINEADITSSTIDEIYDQIITLRNERDVLLGADRSMVLSGELMLLRERLQEAGTRPITIALVDILGEAVDEDTPYGPLDTLLRFDVDLISRGLYPAVDPIVSTSTLLEGSQLEAPHMILQQRARKLLRRYRELRSWVHAHGVNKLSEADVQTYHRGERLEAFLTQPFYVAEPFTKKPGEWLSLQDTMDGVRRIMDGFADEIEPQDLIFIGGWGSI